MLRDESSSCDVDFSESVIGSRSWADALNAIRLIQDVSLRASNPRVAVESKLDDKTFAFFDERHLFNNTLNSVGCHNFSLTD